MENPCGSNSTDTFLSRVSFLTEMRFLTRGGERRTLTSRSGADDVGMSARAVYVTGSRAPFPTVMEAGRERG
jgi:hypothetical protein